MQLPKESASYLVVVSFGRYVARRVKQSGRAALARDLLASLGKLRVAGRGWDDSDDAMQDALADRDAADDALDTAAQTLRAALAGRGHRAERAEPYVLVFPEGVSEYVAAPLDEESARYGLLLSRLEKHLPASDAARKAASAALHAGLRDFRAASEAIEQAAQERAMARSELERAQRTCLRQLEKTYGVLVADLGRSEAERFFPSSRVVRARANAPTPTPPPPSE